MGSRKKWGCMLVTSFDGIYETSRNFSQRIFGTKKEAAEYANRKFRDSKGAVRYAAVYEMKPYGKVFLPPSRKIVAPLVRDAVQDMREEIRVILLKLLQHLDMDLSKEKDVEGTVFLDRYQDVVSSVATKAAKEHLADVSEKIIEKALDELIWVPVGEPVFEVGQKEDLK